MNLMISDTQCTSSNDGCGTLKTGKVIWYNNPIWSDFFFKKISATVRFTMVYILHLRPQRV